jgi:hypothetical protein
MVTYEPHQALVSRLSRIIERQYPLTLVVGSGLTVGAVPGTSAMLELTDQYVEGDERNVDLVAALAAVRQTSRTLGETYGLYRQTVNAWLPAPGFDLVVQAAVLSACANNFPRWRELKWQEARDLEYDEDSWTIPRGVQALADVLVAFPDAFGRRIFTSNFDPLIEIAIRRSGGRATTLSLKADGTFGSVIEDDAIQVVHLHGYWRRRDASDTRSMLHDPTQLTQARPKLESELAQIMQGTTICAVGYGGWEDIFMRTLAWVARWRDVTVMWGFHASDPETLERDSAHVRERLADVFEFISYSGVDTDRLFPSLMRALRAPATPVPSPPPQPASAARGNRPALGLPPAAAATEAPSDLLEQLDGILGWRWDRPGSENGAEPDLVYWSVRLRRPTVIHAVQGRVAAALSALGARVILCLDDLGVGDEAGLSREFEDYIGRLFADVPRANLPSVVSLTAHLPRVERRIDVPLGEHIERLPETPWRVMQYYLAQSSPSILEVLQVSKIIDFRLDESDGQLGAIVRALERLDGNKLLTPVVLWTHFNHVVNQARPTSVMTLGGRDEAPLWQMWRKVFGRPVSNLYNPILSSFRQDSGFVRWDGPEQLEDHLNVARDLPNWDQNGRLIPWLYTNVVLLRAVLDRSAAPPTVADRELSSWPVARALLGSHRRQAIEALTPVIANFFEPGTA